MNSTKCKSKNQPLPMSFLNNQDVEFCEFTFNSKDQYVETKVPHYNPFIRGKIFFGEPYALLDYRNQNSLEWSGSKAI